MNNYLLLKFKTARLFRQFDIDKKTGKKINKKSDNRSFILLKNSLVHCNELPAFVEPITVHQVSNMIHVLFNERPVSTIRGSFYGKNEYLFEKARNSYLKINTPKYFNQFDIEDYIKEISQTKKSVGNSWKPIIKSLNWEMVRRYVNNIDKFNIFIDGLNKYLNVNTFIIPFNDVVKMVVKLDNQTRLSLYDFIKELDGCDKLTYAFGRYNNGVFESPKFSSITSSANRGGITINNGIENVYVFDGEIVIPVSDDDIVRIKKYSKGYANILDGGFVWINKIIPESRFNSDDYLLVGEISTEMTLPYTQKI